MKVLLLNRWSHLETVGGAERVFFSMANALSERHEVTAFAMTQTGEDKPFFEIIPKLKFIHKNHCYEGTKNILLRITRAFHRSRVLRHRCDQKYAGPVWAKVMRPVIEQEMPDVIVAYSLDLARVCLHTLSVACPVIIMFHQSPRVVMRHLTPEDRTTLEKVACVQVLMPSDVSFVEQRVKCRNIICIPNTVKISGFVSTLRNHKILHVGRFSKGDKRQHILIGAFHLLQKDFPDWKLEFWGGTSDQNSYERECYELVQKYHLEERVQFKGTTHDVPEKLSQGSIFAFPSSEEGMGIALVEAMEVGLPAVGFRSYHAVNEIIQNGVNGILCEDGVEPFSEALRTLMENAMCERNSEKMQKRPFLRMPRRRYGRHGKTSCSGFFKKTRRVSW